MKQLECQMTTRVVTVKMLATHNILSINIDIETVTVSKHGSI